jgi:fructose-specific phosphotransferase system IIC component
MFANILPTNFIASTTEIMSSLLTGLGDYIYLVLGVILGAVVIEIIINALKK